MWIFGHLGIGSKLAAPLSRKLPYGWLLLGTILPDLIDKPLFYLLGSKFELISCTRTLGHTAIFTFGLALLASLRKSKLLAAITLGVASHLVLDGFQDYWIHRVLHHEGESSLILAALFPFYEPRFGMMPYDSLLDHLKSGNRPIVLTAEGIGLLFLGWDWWKKKWRPKWPVRIGSVSRRSKGGRSAYGSGSGKKPDGSSRT